MLVEENVLLSFYISACSTARRVLVCSIPIFVLGCGSGSSNVCPGIGNLTAVSVAVTDGSGAPLSDIQVSYRKDGGELRQAGCSTQIPNRCSVDNLGVGEYFLTANKDGYVPNTATVSVMDDGCNVVTENITIVLQRI